MVGRPVQTSPPGSEPIGLTLVKQVLRIDAGDTSQDDYLNLCISTARETAESHTTRAYITQTYREYYDGFPGHHLPFALIDGYDGYGFGGVDGLGRGHDGRRRHHQYFELSRSPLQLLKQIQYLDRDGATQTLDPGQYVLNNRQDPAQITRAPESLGGLPWPIALRQVNSVWIDYIVGYGGNITVSTTLNSAAIGDFVFLPSDVGRPLLIPTAGANGGCLRTSVEAVDGEGNGTAADQAVVAVEDVSAYLGKPILFGDTQAMLMLIGHWDANRLPIVQGIPKEIDYAVRFLLDKERVYYQP
jgi:hypothetical protein